MGIWLPLCSLGCGWGTPTPGSDASAVLTRWFLCPASQIYGKPQEDKAFSKALTNYLHPRRPTAWTSKFSVSINSSQIPFSRKIRTQVSALSSRTLA